MPEPIEVNNAGGRGVDQDLLDRFLADARKVQDERIARPPLTSGPGNCMRCHVPPTRELRFTPLDFGSFARQPLLREAPPVALPLDFAALEARAVARFNDAAPLEKVVQVIARLPEKASLRIGNDAISVSTRFDKAIEAVPGIKLDANLRDVLSSLQTISLQGDTFSAKFDAQKKIALDKTIPLVGKLTELEIGDKNGELKFKLDLDAADPKKLILKDISGVSLRLESGRCVRLHEAALDTTGARPMMKFKIDNPAEKPKHLPESLWPRTVTVPVPLDTVAPGLSADFVGGVLKSISEMRSVLKNKDFSGFLKHIPEEGLRGTVDAILKGVKSIEKNGDTIRIQRDNGVVKHDLGGPSLSIDSQVSFRVGKDPSAPTVFGIRGVIFSAPLPAELKAGATFNTQIKSLSLDHADRDGSRAVTVATSELVDQVRVRVNKEMQPLKDADGNWYAGIRMTNLLSPSSGDKLNVRLRIGSDGNLNMKPSEILDIVGDATGQAADFSLSGAGSALLSAQTRVASSFARFFGW
ncbi:MAG: hypothetical protein K2W95_29440 [Candidatus Obscuribacterales bacterium]|nr:hypothetical protein [Candidatus Obscuribacterales bacterium]